MDQIQSLTALVSGMLLEKAGNSTLYNGWLELGLHIMRLDHRNPTTVEYPPNALDEKTTLIFCDDTWQEQKEQDASSLTTLCCGAADCFARASELCPSSAIPWFHLAFVLHRQERAGIDTSRLSSRSVHQMPRSLQFATRSEMGARQCYLAAIALDKNFWLAWYNLGSLLKTGEQLPCSINEEESLSEKKCFLHSVELNPDHAPSWYNLGLILFSETSENYIAHVQYAPRERPKRKQEIDCTFCFAEAVSLDATVASAWSLLGQALPMTSCISQPTIVVKKGRQSECHTIESCFRRALELDPNDSEAWLGLGRSLDSASSSTRTDVTMSKIDCFKKATELDPNSGLAWSLLGTELMNSREATRDERTRCFVRALNQLPDDAGTWYLLGKSLEPDGACTVLGNSRTAIECYRTAADLDPNLGPAWLSIAELSHQYSPFSQEALYCLSRAAEKMPRDAHVWQELAEHLSDGTTTILNSRPFSLHDCRDELRNLHQENGKEN